MSNEAKYSREDIARRVKMLFATAESLKATNPDAAASYATKAQELAQRHMLDEGELKEKTHMEYRLFNMGANRPWRRSLLANIAKANFCELILAYGINSKVEICGGPTNLDITIAIYSYLVKILDQIAAQDYARYVQDIVVNGKFGKMTSQSTFKTNFFTGAVKEVSERLKKQKDDALNGRTLSAPDSSKLRSLVLVNDKALESFVQDRYPSLRYSKTRTSTNKYDHNGYDQGKAAGRNVSLSGHRQLGSGR